MFNISDYMKEYGKTHRIELTEMSPFAKKVEKSPLSSRSGMQEQ